MSDKRRGLGRGIGALIPPQPPADDHATTREHPVDVFFPASEGGAHARAVATARIQTAGSDVSRETSPDVSRETAAHRSAASNQLSAPSPDAGGLQRAQAARELLAVPGAEFADLPLASIHPNSRQPRQVFDEDALAELVHSIKEVGVLQPVVVRRVAAANADSAGSASTERPAEVSYELIMGERRWRASQRAGLETVPAIIRGTDDENMLRDALLENLHRSDLNPLEEAAAYQQLLDDFGCTQDELSHRIGRSRPQVSNTLRLLRLAPGVQRRVAAGVLSAGHARALLAVDDSAEVEKLAGRIVAEGLSVRAVEEIVSSRTGRRAARLTPVSGPKEPALAEVATRLSDRLDTRVSVALGKSRGRLTVEFASMEDLGRILAVLDPGGPGVSTTGSTGVAAS